MLRLMLVHGYGNVQLHWHAHDFLSCLLPYCCWDFCLSICEILPAYMPFVFSYRILNKGHLNRRGGKKSGLIRRETKLSPTNYTQVISGYFVNIKDPLVPVFCASFAFWWNWSGCGWTQRLSAELQHWADESDSFTTTWLKRMSHRPLSNHFLHNN